MNDLVTRVERLERRLNHWRLACLVTIGLTLAMGAAASTALLRTQRLEITDKQGHARASFEVSDKGAVMLRFFDKKNQDVGGIGLDSEGFMGMACQGPYKTTQLIVGVASDNTPEIKFRDNKSHDILELGLNLFGTDPYMRFKNTKGTSLINLAIETTDRFHERSVLQVTDEDGAITNLVPQSKFPADRLFK
jgi:hypothetical protein